MIEYNKLYIINDEKDRNKLMNIFSEMKLTDEDLLYSEEYSNIKKILILLPYGTIVSGDYYFEKYYLEKNNKNIDFYEKKWNYDIGCNRKVDLTSASLYKELFEELHIDHPNLDIEKIRLEFERARNGIKANIKELFGINSPTSKTSDENKYSYLKLLKLVYKLKKEYGNIFHLFRNPSIINTVHSFIPSDHEISKVLFCMRNQVMKELSNKETEINILNMYAVARRFNYICLARTTQLLYDVVSIDHIDWHYSQDATINENLFYIRRELVKIRLKLKLVSKFNSNTELKKFNNTNIFRTMLFKLMQVERIGIQKDLIAIHKSNLMKPVPLKGIYKNLFLQLDRDKSTISYKQQDIISFINDNIEIITKIIYLKEKVSDSEKKQISKYTRICSNYIERFTRSSDSTQFIDIGIPIPVIIAALQICHKSNTDTKGIFKIRQSFHGANSERKKIITILKDIEETNRYHDNILTAILQAQFMTNIGWIESFKTLNKIRTAIFNICLTLLKIDHLNIMRELSVEISKIIYFKVSWQYCNQIKRSTKLKKFNNENLELGIVPIRESTNFMKDLDILAPFFEIKGAKLEILKKLKIFHEELYEALNDTKRSIMNMPPDE